MFSLFLCHPLNLLDCLNVPWDWIIVVFVLHLYCFYTDVYYYNYALILLVFFACVIKYTMNSISFMIEISSAIWTMLLKTNQASPCCPLSSYKNQQRRKTKQLPITYPTPPHPPLNHPKWQNVQDKNERLFRLRSRRKYCLQWHKTST